MNKLPTSRVNIFFIAILIIFHLPLPAQSFLWAERMGGAKHDYTHNSKTDFQGNTYITGGFTAPATFGNYVNMGHGVNTINAFMAKYDTRGNFIWVKEVFKVVDAVDIDLHNNVYLTGNANLISKYDSDGNLKWLTGRPAQVLGGNAIKVDKDNNTFVTGLFQNSVTFGSNTLSCVGLNDVYIAKYDAVGNILWARQYGTAAPEYVLDIDVDPNGNVFISGYSMLDPLAVNPTEEIYTVKYDPSGNLMWVRKSSPTASNISSYGIAVDKRGNSYITGVNYDTIAFDGIKINTPGSFICKYDPLGNILFAKGTISGDPVRIKLDSHGFPYIFGSWDYPNTCIGRFDTLGNLLNVKSIIPDPVSAAMVVRGTSIGFDYLDNVYLGGFYGDNTAGTTYSATFDNVILYEFGISDIFLTKLENYYGNVEEVFIPNLITPDYDGRNDRFEVFGLGNNVKLNLYNCWGSLIFESDNYKNDWDGNGSSDRIVYYQITASSGKSYKGWLHILNE